MKDRDFLLWIHDRLQYVHKENKLVDYMQKLRAVAIATPKEQDTPNTASYNGTEGILSSQQRVLSEVSAERARQDKKWGQQNHEPEMWLSILGEEFGEVCKAVCEARFTGYVSTGDWSQYRKELIQVAAVACAMVECFDRNRSWKACPASVEITLPAKRLFARDRKCTCVGMTEVSLIAEGTPLEFYGCKECGGRVEGAV